VGGGAPYRLKQAGGTVAQPRIDDPGALRRVAQALVQGAFELVLAAGVGGGDGGELSGAGDAGRAVAPAGPERAAVRRLAGGELVGGDGLGPPPPGWAVLPPAVQEGG